MEFSEKLQELRKAKNLTQEQLAQELHISRTAISKWESGRGYPSIDSLKDISRFFVISLDDLLSGEEILNVAQEDNKQKLYHLRDLVYGLLDCSVAMFLFLPFFGQRFNGKIQEVSLIELSHIEAYVKIPYLFMVGGLILCGIAILALQNCTLPIWSKSKSKISLGLSVITTTFFIMSMQPYAAAFTFLFLIIKAMMLIKWA